MIKMMILALTKKWMSSKVKQKMIKKWSCITWIAYGRSDGSGVGWFDQNKNTYVDDKFNSPTTTSTFAKRTDD